MKEILFSIILLFVALPSGLGQDKTVVIKDDNGTTVPFIVVHNKRSGRSIMSDYEGILTLDKNYLSCESDTLIFHSMFYEPLEVTVSSIKAKQEITLHNKTHDIEVVLVVPKIWIREFMEKTAKHFGNNYAKDYASLVTRLSTDELNGKYCQFHGLKGILLSLNFTQEIPDIYFLDPNYPSESLFPLNVMKSNPMGQDAKSLTNPIHISDKHDIWDTKSLQYNYKNYQALYGLIAKRGIEIYSPLNIEHINNFNYKLDGAYIENGDTIIMINFQTDTKISSKQTRLFGQGIIHSRLSNGQIKKVEIQNMHEYYTHGSRLQFKSPLPSATEHDLIITYSDFEDKLVTKSVELIVNWIDPQNKNKFHSITYPSRPYPVENRLKQYEYYEFSDFVILDSDKSQKVSKYILTLETDRIADCAPFSIKEWENINFADIDKEQLFTELKIGNTSLYQQAEMNSYWDNGHFSKYALYPREKSKTLYLRTKQELYPLIYGDTINSQYIQ